MSNSTSEGAHLLEKIRAHNNFDVSVYLKKLKNNQCMYLTQLGSGLFHEWDMLSKDAQYYLMIPYILIGTRDFRPRIGKFEDPWKSKVHPLYAAPPLKFIKDSLADIADNRAIQLINNAKSTGRDIAVMWSGGIDSTVMLTSILKNISDSDQELLTVFLTTHSISDNPDFYFKFLSSNKKIQIKNAATLRVDNSFLDKTLLLTGDPGDGVFGPSSSMYSWFSECKKHLEPWRDHLKTIMQLLEPNIERDMLVQPGIGEWFTNIVTQNLEESGYADHVSSVTDWYWWTYFNYKWSSLCSYPLHNSIMGEQHKGITHDNHKFYAENIFYHTTQWQLWSYSNLKELVGPDVFKTHKLKAREYIYEFDKNFQYFSRKRKTSTPPPNMKLQKSSLIGHDENWKPIYLDHYPDRYLITLILSRYKTS